MYLKRTIDTSLKEWSEKKTRKPLLLRGARQVGKSTAVRHLGNSFKYFAEINFEKSPKASVFFKQDLDVKRIIQQLSALIEVPIIPGETLLFMDEIQSCPEAIMSLRFFKEDIPDLHVIGAGSLLEFALSELATFGVGRIHSMFMFPMSFDEFLEANNGENILLKAKRSASSSSQMAIPLHDKLVSLFRTFLLIGGMPAVVKNWIETSDYISCAELLDDLVAGYESDFPKYRKKIDPELMRLTFRSCALQTSKKFNYSLIGNGYKTDQVKRAVELLILAGIVIPVTKTAANGIPLGAESDLSFRKMLILDTGLLLRMLNMALGDVSEITEQILTSTAADLVNKGTIAEMSAGLEMVKYAGSNIKRELFYWTGNAKNSQAEVDYVTNYLYNIVPIEVKANVQGGMKSLWMFMRDKKITKAVRISLENFGKITHTDNNDIDSTGNPTQRAVEICPLYALSSLSGIIKDMFDS